MIILELTSDYVYGQKNKNEVNPWFVHYTTFFIGKCVFSLNKAIDLCKHGVSTF